MNTINLSQKYLLRANREKFFSMYMVEVAGNSDLNRTCLTVRFLRVLNLNNYESYNHETKTKRCAYFLIKANHVFGLIDRT